MTAPKRCYTLDDFSPEKIRELLVRAEELRNETAGSILKGKTAVLMFLASSLRTRVSMELAARHLGAHCVTLSADGGLWKLEFNEGVVMRHDTAEHVKEAVRVLASYGDLLAVRAFPSKESWEKDAADPVLNAFLEYADVPIINMESCLYHPCQALADLLTIKRHVGEHPGKIVLSWADHPKPLPVAVPNSFALAVTQMGWDLTIARPEGYDLPPEVMAKCEQYVGASGRKLEVTADREAAFENATVVYAKSWGRLDRYGEPEKEIAERKAARLEKWCVDREIMAKTDDAVFMHCLPVRRNVIVSDDVIDSPRSLVIPQAQNRLHAQKSLMVELLS